MGTVEVSKLTFSLEAKTEEYFICLLSHGTTLQASEVVKASGDSFTFSTSFTFKNLPSDFVIEVKLYSLKQNHPGNYLGGLIHKYRVSCCFIIY